MRARTLRTLIGSDACEATKSSSPVAKANRSLPRSVFRWTAAVCAFVGLNAVLYLLSGQSYVGDSDKASTILEGQALGNGHVLLHGWVLSVDSFWTLDQVYYAVATHVANLGIALLHSGPAFFGAVLVVAGVAAACEGCHGRAALIGSLVVVGLLVFPSPTLSFYYLGLASHTATAVYALLAFLALRRGRFGWPWVVAVLLLTLGLLGDLQMIAYGVFPVLLAGIVAMARGRDWRGGVAPVAAALSSIALAEVVRTIVDALGGFVVAAPLRPASLDQMLVNTKLAVKYGADLVGIGNLLSGHVPGLLLRLHAVTAVLMVTCFLVALWTLLRGIRKGAPPLGDEGPVGTSRLDDMLLIATFGPVAAYIVLSDSSAIGNIRYIVPSILFLAILSGRVVARGWSKFSGGLATRALGFVGLLAFAGLAAGLGYELSPPQPVNPAVGLAQWLEAHDLHNGVGDYWAASITTVASGGAVAVRPVGTDPTGRLVRRPNQSSSSWYSNQRFQFLVYGVPVYDDVDATSATSTWGPPVRRYTVGQFRVLVWSETITVPPSGK